MLSLSLSESVSKEANGSEAGGDRIRFRESKLMSLECGENGNEPERRSFS